MRPMQRETSGGCVRWVTTVRGFRVEGRTRRRCERESRSMEAMFGAWGRMAGRLPEVMREVGAAAGEALVRVGESLGPLVQQMAKEASPDERPSGV